MVRITTVIILVVATAFVGCQADSENESGSFIVVVGEPNVEFASTSESCWFWAPLNMPLAFGGVVQDDNGGVEPAEGGFELSFVEISGDKARMEYIGWVHTEEFLVAVFEDERRPIFQIKEIDPAQGVRIAPTAPPGFEVDCRAEDDTFALFGFVVKTPLFETKAVISFLKLVKCTNYARHFPYKHFDP